jgi:hypothetical protein
VLHESTFQGKPIHGATAPVVQRFLRGDAQLVPSSGALPVDGQRARQTVPRQTVPFGIPRNFEWHRLPLGAHPPG